MKTAVTKALDASIAHVATKQLARLTVDLSPKQAAEAIHCSLRSLARLQSRKMPSYDAWDALFYSVWYQPSHINLAYILARKMPKDRNPILSGGGSLQVVDFGCGALATQFGLALAAADTSRGQTPRISVISQDSSKDMVRIGRNIWTRFVKEIANKKKYPELKKLRKVCAAMKTDNQDSRVATRWVTALHVAYEESAVEVREELDRRVKSGNPDLILVTTHPQNTQAAYAPRHSISDKYDEYEIVLKPQDYTLDRNFRTTSAFRQDVYHQKIDGMPELLCDCDKEFVKLYLTRYRTAWVTPKFESSGFFYTRR